MRASVLVLASPGVRDAELDEIVEAYERDGFVNGGPVLAPSETAALLEDLERYIDTFFRAQDRGVSTPLYYLDIGRPRQQSHYQMCGMWQVSEAFRRLITNERLVNLAARLTQAKTLQVWIDTVQYKPQRHGAHFQWHQDAPYHVSIEPATALLGAWIALDDADLDNGCMWMVPGSHRWGEQERHLWKYMSFSQLEQFSDITPPEDAPQIAAQWQRPVPCPVRAGEVHFHHALTWHGSPANSSERSRRAYTLHFMRNGMRASERSDVRVRVPAGTPMIDAGPDFPVVYRASLDTEQP